MNTHSSQVHTEYLQRQTICRLHNRSLKKHNSMQVIQSSPTKIKLKIHKRKLSRKIFEYLETQRRNKKGKLESIVK